MKDKLKIILLFIIPAIFATIITKLVELGVIPYEIIMLAPIIIITGLMGIASKIEIEEDPVVYFVEDKLLGFDREIPREEIEKHLKELNLDTTGFNLNRILITSDETKSDLEIVKEVYEKLKQTKEDEE